MLIAGFASNAKRIAVPTVEHGAFIHQNVVAGFDGLLFGLFHRMARSSGQGLAVVERNELEYDGGSVGSVDLSHNRERATQFHEATTRNTARFEHSLKL